jgi:hypothetical protein
MLRRLFARLFGERGDVTEEDRERLGAHEEEKRRMAQEDQQRMRGDGVSGSMPFWGDPR